MDEERAGEQALRGPRQSGRWLPGTRQLAVAVLVVGVPLLAACGSSGRTKDSAKAPSSTCAKLNAVLSDGPDPDADPVGYALSQILPLSKIATSDSWVAATIKQLVAADHALVNSKGADHAATAAIKKADHTLNKACPGVAP